MIAKMTWQAKASLLLMFCTHAGCGGTGDGPRDASMDWLDAADPAPDSDDAVEDPVSDATCQAPEGVSVSLTIVPNLVDGEFTEDGTVESIDTSAPDRVSFTVRYPGMTAYPPEHTYTVPITSGDQLDLDAGDAVRVRFERDRWGDWIQTGLHVERDGATILFFLDCLHHCSFMFMETAPLEVETLSGACVPEEDAIGCVMQERRGYRVICPSPPSSVDVFDHNLATIACDAGYLIMVGDHSAVTEHLMTCSGVPDDRIEAAFLRLR